MNQNQDLTVKTEDCGTDVTRIKVLIQKPGRPSSGGFKESDDRLSTV